jgi:capsular polysaccharide transport system permease protein
MPEERLQSFWCSLSIQVRVIGALLMREIVTGHGRQNIGFLWIIVEPMMFTSGVTAIRAVFEHLKPGIPIVAFTVTGYATVLLWRNTIGHVGEAVVHNRSLLFHRNVRIIDLFIARILHQVAGATVSFLVLTSFFVFIGLMKIPHDIVKIIEGWLIFTWFTLSMGMIVGSLTIYSETFGRLWHVFAYLFLGLSGAFFMVDWLPSKYQHVALLIPTVDCIELVRDGYFGPSVRTHYQILYTLCVNLGLMLIGLSLVQHSTKWLEERA